MLIRLRCLICFALLAFSIVHVQSQAHSPEVAGTTLKAASRLVVVDVVVRDRVGQQIQGLSKEDFKVFEDGRPQIISVFEEHTGKAPAVIKTPALPPDTFSNSPRSEAPDSLNVVLLDALNTPLQDQSYVHQQVLKYLAGMHTDEPIAIFILSTQLRMVHGFTSDLSVLLAALNDKKSGSGPQGSLLLRSPIEAHVEDQAAAQMQELATLDPNIQAAIDSLRQFLAESESSQTDLRVRITTSGLQQLAQYLSVFPGRKNVIWFSGTFPLTLFKDPSKSDTLGDRDFQEYVRKTANELTKARVAIYPVGAEGLAPDSLYDTSAPPLKVTSAAQATQVQVSQLHSDSLQRTGRQAAMDEFAKGTGGIAFYNTNGFDGALEQAIHDGKRYYTLGYVPTNKEMDGKYRRIQVKLTKGHSKLSYRQGYNAEEKQRTRAVTDRVANIDPLQPLMTSGLPNFAQILYIMNVKPTSPQPEVTSPRAGDNVKLAGPFTRMDVNLAVSEKALELQATPDGMRHGTLEFALIAYDRYGNQMNWLVRTMEVSLTAERYKDFWDSGLQFHFEFDAPRGTAYLRSGVCDTVSQKVGTIEVLLREPVAVPQQAKPN